MRKYFLIFVFFFTYLTSQDSLKQIVFDINDYADNRFDESILHLDYNNLDKTSFLIDKYLPNHFSDYSMYALKVSGAMKAPIFQLIPEKIFFDINKDGKISQLSYHEKKSYNYFDTKIALKVDINDQVRFLGFVESKSHDNNINQNYLLNINKSVENKILNISYMYHVDDAPIDYMNESVHDGCEVENYFGFSYVGGVVPSNCTYDSFQKYNESFFFGLDYQYEFGKWKLYYNSAYQVSNNIKEFLSDTNQNFNEDYKWHSMMFSYDFNSKSEIFFDNQYKKTTIENYTEDSVIDCYQNIFSVGFNYKLFNDYFIKLNYDVLSTSSTLPPLFHASTGRLGFSLRYNKPLYNVIIGIDNNIQSDFYVDNQNVNLPFDMYYSFDSKEYMKFDFKSNHLENNFEYGSINIKHFDEIIPFASNQNSLLYSYSLLDTKLKFNLFSVDFTYRFYDTDYTFINEYIALGLTYSPKLSNVRFRPYGKILLNSITINSMYEIDLKSTNLFNYDMNNLSGDDHTVEIIKAELGLMFDSFKITYKIMNPFKERFNEEVQYSNKLLPLLGRHSTINIIWTFQD